MEFYLAKDKWNDYYKFSYKSMTEAAGDNNV